MDDKNLKENNIDNQEIIPSEDSFPLADTSSNEPEVNPASEIPENIEVPSPVNPPDTVAETPSPENSSVASSSPDPTSSSSSPDPTPSVPSSESSSQDPLPAPSAKTFVPTPEPSAKKPFPKKILLLASGIALFIILAVIVLPKLFGNKFGDMSFEEYLYDSNSFCLQEGALTYIMFDIDGKQLFDEKFQQCNQFINGATAVQNKEGKYAIISSEGKIVTGYDVCDTIDQEGPLYECIHYEENKIQYLNAKGKVITESTSAEAEAHLALPDNVNDSDKFLILKRDYGYDIFGYNGTLITSIKAPAESVPDDPEDYSLGQYAVVFYNNKNYLLDLANEKLLTTFDDDKMYQITTIDEENDNEFIIESTKDGSVYAYSSEDRTIKLIKNGRVAFSKDVKASERIDFVGDKIIFTNDEHEYIILDDSGKEVLKYEENYTIKDSQHFLKRTDDGKTELYSNGNTKTFDCFQYSMNSFIAKKDEPYLLKQCGDSRTSFYVNQDGDKINDKEYKDANLYDDNGYAVVSEDGENYYLIDYSGKKVSESYKATYGIINAINDSDFYRVELDDEAVIFRVGGKEILRVEDYIGGTMMNKTVFVSTKSGSDYKIYNLETGKEVVTLDSAPSFRPKYFFTNSENSSKKKFYSFTTGKQFFEGAELYDLSVYEDYWD